MSTTAPHGWILEAEQKIDVSPILREEFARLGDPLPVQVAQAGPRGVDRRAREVLREGGLAERFTESDYRRAVRQALADLTGNADVLNDGSPLTAGDLIEDDAVRAIRARGEEVTAEGYSAERDAQAAGQDIGEEVLYAGDPGGEIVHSRAMRLLAEQGKEHDHTADEYRSALRVAFGEVTVHVPGRRS